jgi:hypothetical protein
VCCIGASVMRLSCSGRHPLLTVVFMLRLDTLRTATEAPPRWPAKGPSSVVAAATESQVMLDLVRLTVTSVINAHVNVAGLCSTHGHAWPCELVVLTEHGSRRYGLPPELGRSGDRASSHSSRRPSTPARGHSVAPCRGPAQPCASCAPRRFERGGRARLSESEREVLEQALASIPEEILSTGDRASIESRIRNCLQREGLLGTSKAGDH